MHGSPSSRLRELTRWPAGFVMAVACGHPAGHGPALLSLHVSPVYTLCCARSLPRSAVPKNGELMASSAAKLCRHLAPAAQQGRSLDIWREIGMMTMDVVGSCAFGERPSVAGDVDVLPAEPWGRLAARHLRQAWLRPIGLSPAS